MIEELKNIVDRTAKQVESLFPDLSVFVLLHGSGLKSDKLLLDQEAILDHPAGKNTLTLFQRNMDNEKTAFHGLGTSTRKGFLVFQSFFRYQAAISLNVDEFDDLESATTKLYCLFCEAMDFAAAERKANKEIVQPVIVPKSFFKSRVRQNLRSYAFATVMMQLDGGKDSIEKTATRCAQDTLSAKAGVVPEENPFVLAAQITQFAYTNIFADLRNQIMPVLMAYHIAHDIEKSLDEASLKYWYKFASAAQDMAWQGYSSVNIINAALVSAESHPIRGIAYLIAEMTDVRTSAFQLNEKAYNPFSDIEDNQKIHLHLVSDIFEKAVTKGIEEGTARPLFDLANEQNARLLKGKVMGWCAAGLQAAGKAFEGALHSGREPLQSAWLEFEGHKSADSWESLQKIAKSVMAERRSSNILSLEGLHKMLAGMPNMRMISEAIQVTLDDSRFMLTQAANHHLYAVPSARPAMDFAPMATPQPSAAPKGPVIEFAPKAHHAAPSLGLGGTVGQAQRALQNQVAEKEQHADQ